MSLRAAATDEVSSWLSDLASAESGVGFIYRCLDGLVEGWDLRDALLVLDDANLGRQAFRAGRAIPESRWASWHAKHARPGLYTEPTVIDGTATLDAALALCRVALRLDLGRYDSLHDSLTGLYNRRCFEDMLAQAAGRSKRYGWSFSLVLIDLDGFKQLNDERGHDAGDAVLRALGNEMRQVLRRGDVAARIGGDEFALVLPEADPDFVPQLLARMRAGVGAESQVGFSTGIVTCPQEAEETEALFRIADQRLYEHKQRPRP